MSNLRLILISVLVLILCATLYFSCPRKSLDYSGIDSCVNPSNLSPASAMGRYEDPDAYAVYSVIVPTVAPHEKSGMWLIRGETLPYSKRYDWQPSRLPLTAASKNYLEVNAKSWFLQNNFSLPGPYRLLSAEELRRMFPANSTELFAERWIELSAVGFNPSKTAAVVYMEHWCTESCCCGDGHVYQLKKMYFGIWRITNDTQCWIS